MIYFIICKDANRVKIGYTSGPLLGRLQTISTSSPYPLDVAGVIHEGTLSDEKELHNKFSDLRVHREWFLWGAELKHFVKTECSPNPITLPKKRDAKDLPFPANIIKSLGGADAVADIAGVAVPTVYCWQNRKPFKIPSAHWASLLASAKTSGVDLTADDFMSLEDST